MTKTAENLKIELAQLPVQDRAELAYFLIHSLDEGVDNNVFDAWDRELTQRLAEIYAGTAIIFAGDLYNFIVQFPCH